MDCSNHKDGESSLEGDVSSRGTMSSESGSFYFKPGNRFYEVFISKLIYLFHNFRKRSFRKN